MIWLYVASWLLVGWGGLSTLIYVAAPSDNITRKDIALIFLWGFLGPLVPLLFLFIFLKDEVDWDKPVIRRKGAIKQEIIDKLTQTGDDDE